jgi:4-phytase/acid phosphatase
VKNSCLAAILAAALAIAWPASGADAPQLKYVVIVTRHGVRSPTWETARLNPYSSEPWPEWEVPPGNLTPHGRALIKLMGAYYREWLSGEHLLRVKGCQDAQRIYIRADKDQRTVETGRALAESLLPGCGIAVHSQPVGESDQLFSGAGTPDVEHSLKAVRNRLGPDPQQLLADHSAALDALQFILHGTRGKTVEPGKIGVSMSGKSVELQGPFATGSTFSENLLLEYANGMQGTALGWGRLTRENLERILEVHAVYADLMRRTPYIASARGSNLLAHVLRSLEQAVSDKRTPGALGQPGDALLILSGHDTNLSNLSGMLGLSWKLAGYQPDDAPPGGALVFSLWRDPNAGGYLVKLRYLAQTLDQMRDAVPLSVASPPARQDVALPGCPEMKPGTGCPWGIAQSVIQKAIDPDFTLMDDPHSATSRAH